MFNVEIQAINYILANKNLDILHKEGIEPSYFLANKEHIDFILNHKDNYGVIPDIATFSNQFKDFPIIKVTESPTYLADKIREATLFQKVVPIVNQFRDKMQRDSVDATEYILQAISDVRGNIQFKKSLGTDIISSARDRYEDFTARIEKQGLLGITTGIKELDLATHGWLPEDAVVLFARTNEGKSWIAEYFAVQAWKAGSKVLYYAGEMSALMMGYRFDTLYRNISNSSMLQGCKALQNEYDRYTNELAKQSGLVVVTPQDFGGKKPTIRQIKEVAKELEIDIVFLDQLSLLDDERSSDNKTVRYGNISQDVLLASKELQIPFITVAQANRESEKDKKDNAPKLHQIEYSDQVGQDATRAVSIKYSEGILTISLNKNRFGGKNVDVMLKWDIDKGIIEPMLSQDELSDLGEEFGF